MTTDKLIKYGGIAAMVILAGQKAATAAANQVLVDAVSVTVNSRSPVGFDVSIDVFIDNNLPVTVSIDNFIADIKYGTAILSHLTLPQPVVISASSITPIRFNTIIKIADLLASGLEVAQSGQYLNGLTIKGKVITPDLVIRINQAIHPI